MRLTHLILAAVLLAAPMAAQEAKDGPPSHATDPQASNQSQTPSSEEPDAETADVWGQVVGFGGDEAKPVPFASVYLLYFKAPDKAGTAEKEKVTAGVFYGLHLVERLREMEGLAPKYDISETPFDFCWTVQTSAESLKATLDWAVKNAPGQVLQTKAGEAGQFGFVDLQPGLWYVVVGGQVENAPAVWEEFVPVHEGKIMMLDPIEPEATCAVPGEDQNPD